MKERKDKLLLSVKKAYGTIKKVEEMIEKNIYCADIANQINASIGLLQSANRELLKHHLSTCGVKSFIGESTTSREDFIEELVRVWDVVTRK